MKILIYLLIVITSVVAMPYERPRFYCGRALAEARIFFCFGPEIAWNTKRIFYEDTWYLRKHDRNDGPQLHNRILRREPGLADVCCLNPCYIHQLLDYC